MRDLLVWHEVAAFLISFAIYPAIAILIFLPGLIRCYLDKQKGPRP